MGRFGVRSLVAGASITALGMSSLVVGGAPLAGVAEAGVVATTTSNVSIAMTCNPDPLTKEEIGNTSLSAAIANGLFDPGPDTIRWTADDVPLSPMALSLDMAITHPTTATPGAANAINVELTQDFGQMATDTLNETIIPQLSGPPRQPLTLRSFWLVFGSSYPRLGLHMQPPSGTTFDVASLLLNQTPSADNAISHGVPPLLTTGLTDATGAAEANSTTALQVELGDENDTNIANSFYLSRGDRGAVTGFVVEPAWTDAGVASPPAPSVVAPSATWTRTQSEPFTVDAAIDIDVPISLAGSTVDFYPVNAPVDFNLGIWLAATLDGQTTTTSGRVNFDWECTADDTATSLLTVPVATVPSVVSGTVTEDTSNDPLSGISVRLLNSTGASVVAATTTDGSGNYSFPSVEPGDYQLRYIDMDGLHTPEYNVDAATAGAATTINVDGTGTAVDVDASLAPNSLGIIRGTVTEDGTGTPLQGISTRLLNSTGTVLLAGRTTAANGTYNFGMQPHGDYLVRFIDLDDSHMDEFNVDKPNRLTADVVSHTVWITTVNAGLANI